MQALTFAVLALLTWRHEPLTYAPHLAQHALPPKVRAAQIAEYYDRAAKASDLPASLLLAKDYHESSLDALAVSRRGARGMSQLNPKTPWGKSWQKDCALDHYACQELNVVYGALALKHYVDTCGSTARALTAYRTGKCGPPGPRAMATMQLARVLQNRLRFPSEHRIAAVRLP